MSVKESHSTSPENFSPRSLHSLVLFCSFHADGFSSNMDQYDFKCKVSNVMKRYHRCLQVYPL